MGQMQAHALGQQRQVSGCSGGDVFTTRSNRGASEPDAPGVFEPPASC
jgi:hypothetical protein